MRRRSPKDDAVTAPTVGSLAESGEPGDNPSGGNAMKKATISLLISIVSGCGDSAEPTSTATVATDDIRSIASSYTTITAMTDGPVHVDANIAFLCAPTLSKGMIDEIERKRGPHALTAVRIFMSEKAAETFAAKTTPYPVGAIIIKEKQAQRSPQPSTQPAAAHDGVGGMVKRPPGYDPDHGDWEYFFFQNPDAIERGKMASCVQCHAGVASKDYVFGDWATSTFVAHD